MSLYREETKELLCRAVPHYGAVSSDPSSPPDDGYISAIPPCLWGQANDKLSPPPRLSLGTRLLSVAHYNASYEHTGVVAHWELRGAWALRAHATEWARWPLA